MNGLTVRWSLEAAPRGAEEALADYVEATSYERFSELPGLCFKTWRMRPGEWFEGLYVFADDEARVAFQELFAAGAAEAPGSRIVGSAPVTVEPCTVVAVAEGAAGFVPSSRVE
jgi:hypothetical protein